MLNITFLLFWEYLITYEPVKFKLNDKLLLTKKSL